MPTTTPPKRRRARAALVGTALLAVAVSAALVVEARQPDDVEAINGESRDTQHPGGIELAARASSAQAAGAASVANDTLTVTGTDASERIALGLAPGVATTLRVDFGDDGSIEQTFDRGTFSKIVVRSGAGSDRVRVDEVNGRFTDEQLTLDGGGGDDTLVGGSGVDALLGGTGNDRIDGGPANDTVDLGSGRDTFAWSPGKGNDAIEGQAGTDTVHFVGSSVDESMRLSANGTHATLFRNVASVTLDMNAVEQVELVTLGGVDTIAVPDMSATALQRALVDLSGSGGAGDGVVDTVTVTGIVDGAETGVATVEGRVELQGLRTAVAVAGAEPDDVLDVTVRGGPQADVADIMDVELTLTQSGFSHGG